MFQISSNRQLNAVQGQPQHVRFGAFELDIRAGELRGANETVRLQEQPFQILLMLLGREGEVITREEIRKKLWSDDIIVEFDHSINTAIKKLRRALGDSAGEPKYVETVARRGYRLMAAVQPLLAEGESSVSHEGRARALAEGDDHARCQASKSGLIGRTASHHRSMEALRTGRMDVPYKPEELKFRRQAVQNCPPEKLSPRMVELHDTLPFIVALQNVRFLDRLLRLEKQRLARFRRVRRNERRYLPQSGTIPRKLSDKVIAPTCQVTHSERSQACHLTSQSALNMCCGFGVSN